MIKSLWKAARRWLLTKEREEFLQYPPAEQIAFLVSTWWKKMDWVVVFPYKGLSKGLSKRFKDTTRNYLLELPVETRIPGRWSLQAHHYTDEIKKVNPGRRIVEKDNIAGVAIFLASRAGNFNVGSNIVVDGGE